MKSHLHKPSSHGLWGIEVDQLVPARDMDISSHLYTLLLKHDHGHRQGCGDPVDGYGGVVVGGIVVWSINMSCFLEQASIRKTPNTSHNPGPCQKANQRPQKLVEPEPFHIENLWLHSLKQQNVMRILTPLPPIHSSPEKNNQAPVE